MSKVLGMSGTKNLVPPVKKMKSELLQNFPSNVKMNISVNCTMMLLLLGPGDSQCVTLACWGMEFRSQHPSLTPQSGEEVGAKCRQPLSATGGNKPLVSFCSSLLPPLDPRDAVTDLRQIVAQPFSDGEL